MNITFSNSAISDLNNIKEYYLSQGVPRIGIEFVSKIITHIETLADNPDIGRVVPEFDDILLRELIQPPFRIVYLRETETLKIVRVWRSECLLKLKDK